MATEFKLNYTGSEINQKLATVDETKNNLENNYYTSVDIDDKLDNKADLVDGKIPTSQLPDDIGGSNGSGGSAQIQVDYDQNDETQLDFIKNRPFYDTRIRSYYSQVENPNPLAINNAILNMSFYKVSDLVPTRDEIFNNTKVVVNGYEHTFSENYIILETDDFIFVTASNSSYGFIFVNKAGTLNFTYQSYPMSLEAPEAGIYYQRGLNAGVPAGRTIEFQTGNGELKQIDPKFIPANLDFNLDDYYTKSEIDDILGDCDAVLDQISVLIGE